MKIAISATGNNLEAQVDPAFGRCKFFIIYDSGTNDYTAIQNQGSSLASGAGSNAVQTILNQGVDALITGKVGLKSRPLLERAGITISENQTGPILDILSSIKPTSPHQQSAPSHAAGSAEDPHLPDKKPAGYCFCPACGRQGAGDPQIACFKQRCPQCGCGLERKYR